MRDSEIRELVGSSITFSDGREGIISGGSLKYGWARSMDGMIAHEYSWETIARKIANGSKFSVN